MPDDGAPGLDQLDRIARRGRADKLRHAGVVILSPTVNVPVSKAGLRRKSPTGAGVTLSMFMKTSLLASPDQRVQRVRRDGIDFELHSPVARVAEREAERAIPGDGRGE